ncbi:MAG: hypothetical protein L3J76_00165 [Candidatus Hydrothermae bacterium]|nr:hypothetical protein [Candidatus Hydrothermae bacterium]
MIKVIRLESYEDALNNIAFDEESGQQALALYGDEYLLRYMLRWEAKKSETLLDVKKLQSPFSYKLRIHRDGETREQAVDLPETFNYLIGLDVEKRMVYSPSPQPSHQYEYGVNSSSQPSPHRGEEVNPSPQPSPHRGEGVRVRGKYLVYRGTTRDGRKVCVIWRETKGWTEEDYQRDAEFVQENGLVDGVDEVFVNGDSVIPGARSLDGVFKARLFGQVEG